MTVIEDAATTLAQLSDGRRDLERAIAELGERMPGPLRPLARLAFNYRWSWLAGGPDLFRDIDPGHWEHGGCNPRHVLEAVTPRRWQELEHDQAFLDRLQAVLSAVEADLARPDAAVGIDPLRPVAYFCSEFGVHASLPLYGGGLGVLAGDLLKAASDLAIPMVGVGLLYREGYFHQRLDTAGWQHEYWVSTDFERQPAVLVTRPDGQPLTVELRLRDRLVLVQVWRIDIGRVRLYLLDTDLRGNNAIDRWITARLYVGDRHTRLAQYAVLGIGGVRVLAALGIRPGLVHLNEGHAALGSFERLRNQLERGQPFEAALAQVRRTTVFTTHTPVPAGNEGYAQSEVEAVLADFIDRLGIPRATFYNLGRLEPGNEREPANITPLALRTSRAANGVARRHGEVARAMWQPLWRELPATDVPIAHVTNGVHTLTWMAAPMQALLDRHLGPEWRTRLDDRRLWEGVNAIPDEDLWAVRCQQRLELIQLVRERSVYDRLGRGEAPDYVEAAARVFDDRALTIGFARRVATYKRLYLLTRFADRGLRLLAEEPMPIQLIIAGKAHPQDNEAKASLRGLFDLKRAPGVGGRIVFLDDYDLHSAPQIMAGVDLWLNLPRPPLEASGTSGMKVAINGGLNLSVLDGWWVEGYDGHNGWAIESPPADPYTQDDHDAHALMDLLEYEVIPLFYERGGSGIPHRWLQRVKAALRTLIPQFGAERMLRDYVETMYRES
ncbi:MAG: alpha-glucan family phosphorylase [Deltaproteobacteria bacterium]|nr:alpha-glucan family phosphorylase [Deltaproteobacteria bacterium]